MANKESESDRILPEISIVSTILVATVFDRFLAESLQALSGIKCAHFEILPIL